MNLIYKTLTRAGGRSLYLHFPPGVPRSGKRTSALIILRDGGSEDTVVSLLTEGGLLALAGEQHVILAFPNPSGGRWNFQLHPALPDDVAFLTHIQGELTSPEESVPFSMALAASSNPLKDERFQKLWHPMADVRYMAGFGTGASMACAFAALRPQWTAAVFAQGGALAPAALQAATGAAVPAVLAGCPQATADYFIRANQAVPAGGEGTFINPVNPCARVLITGETGAGALLAAYDALFSRVRRPDTVPLGDVEPRLQPHADDGFTLYEEDKSLGDGLPHAYLVHVPKSVRAQPGTRVPLVMCFHGASDNPLETADVTKFHEVGEREGFITVYPWSTNRMTWNSSMLPDEPDDDRYAAALIRAMTERFPVDPERVYLSGFSNGAGEAQAVALCHPDLVAAICPIDANWPGNRMGETDLDVMDVAPMRIGMERKEVYDYRMPVWYTYGGREVSYPVYHRSTQQRQYDFWKAYNHIPIVPTPGRDNPHPCGCGVPGDWYERLTPSAAHPEHEYHVQRFLSADPGNPNLYNFAVMMNKGHDVAAMDAELGWRYVSRFRRKRDGSLVQA